MESVHSSKCPPAARRVTARLALLACVLAGAWPGSASAAPGVIKAPRVEAFSAPSTEAEVVSELGQGAPVCVLDATSDQGIVLRRPGWLAIRLPGGVGYVPADAVDVAAPAPAVVDCGGPISAPQDADPAPPSPPAAPSITVLPLAPSPPRPAPVAAAEQPALLAGRFLPLHPARIALGLGTGAAWLDKQVAARHQLADSGITFNGMLGLTVFDVFMVSGAFAVAFPSDMAPFSEVVVPEMGGDARTADSSVAVTSYSFAAELRTPFLALGATDSGWVGGAVFAEYGTAQIHGTRTISNCSDCRTDELDMPGGAFWRFGVDLLIPSRRPTTSYGLSVSYQRYAPGAGFSDELRIGFTGWLL